MSAELKRPFNGPPGPNLNIAPTASSNFTPGGFWRRFVASMVDGVIISVFKLLVDLPMAVVLHMFFANPAKAGTLTTTGNLLNAVIGLTIYFVAIYNYYGHFYSTKGATPGKSLMGLKVFDTRSGKYLDHWAAFKREVVGKTVSSLVLGIGFFMVGFRKDKMSLHDKLFGTRVVHSEKP